MSDAICYVWADQTILMNFPVESWLQNRIVEGMTRLEALDACAKYGWPITAATASTYHIMENWNPPAEYGWFQGFSDSVRNAETEGRLSRAWKWENGNIVCDMPKARLLHLVHIRRARNTEIKELDVPYLRALEVGDTVEQQRITGLKQALRDIPATFDITTDVDTPEALKARWPAELPARE